MWVYHRITTLKIQLKFLTNTNTELIYQNQLLQQEKITHIQKIEQLHSKTGYLDRLIIEADKARHESFESAKAALFDLGGELSKQLIDIHRRENQEARELSEKNIAGTTEKFNNEFERLVNMIGALSKEIGQSKDTVDIIKQSLLSPSGAGLLAEITLENILKASGLRANVDFIIQYNLTTIENTKLRPDAIIFLPGDNIMVIDAKASKFLVDDQEAENLNKTMNSHLKSLNSKEYAENILTSFHNKGQSFGNIITLMFLPTEQAVEKILSADHNFMNKAWSANIFPVGPAGLINMLSFAKFQISDHMRSENHKLIVEEVRKLLLSVANLADYSQKIGANIQNIAANYDKFAASFNRNFLSRAKNIQKLGIDTGSKDVTTLLQRYQVVTSKSEFIDHDVVEDPKPLKELPEPTDF
jgi:DNA recombination protein RmuC